MHRAVGCENGQLKAGLQPEVSLTPLFSACTHYQNSRTIMLLLFGAGAGILAIPSTLRVEIAFIK